MRVTHPLGRQLDVTRLIDVDDPDEKDTLMTNPNLAFIAMSTTGSSADSHEIWELSVQLRLDVPGSRDVVCHWQLPVAELQRADGRALHELRFYERYRGQPQPVALDVELGSHRPMVMADIARQLAAFLLDAHPVMLHPEHDQPFLAAFLRRQGQPAAWKPAVPVTALAAGAAYGYAAGWNRHVEVVQPDLFGDDGAVSAFTRRIDTSGYGMPWRPVDLAKDMGLSPSAYADPVSAAGRLDLTVQLWDAVVQPLAPLAAPSAAAVAEASTAVISLAS
ncbi:hypothetical protein [Nonomuraea recticatena]